jgi:hypothetical protein
MTISAVARREIYFLFGFVFIFAGLVIWIRTETVKDTYVYVKQEKDFRKLQQEIQAIRVRWLRQTAPRRLEVLAKNLHLSPPTMEQILKYEPEQGSENVTP